VLATDRARLVGDPVALVVAESRYLAEDACELIDVEYVELPAVASVEQAQDAARPAIFEEIGSNVLVPANSRQYGDFDAVFGEADRVLSLHLDTHRVQNVPMECRGSVSSWDEDSGSLTMWSACQGTHTVRGIVAKKLGLEPERVRIRTGDVGGSFGLKVGASREDIACAVASRVLRRPVKWTEDRYENLNSSGQAREETFDVAVAITGEGEILGLDVHMIIDAGAYTGMGGGVGGAIEATIPGPYKMRAMQFETAVMVTNKATYVPYRGPWAAETFVRERVVDTVARAIGKDPLEVRMLNCARPGLEPADMITGRSLVGVTAYESLARMREVVDIAAFRARQAAAAAEGRYLGLGMATFIEAAPGPRGSGPVGMERMGMELADDGTVHVFTAQMPHGQSHETTIAQVAADELGTPFEDIRVVVGDSDLVPPGFTGGSRAATMMGGAARMSARELRRRILMVAGHLLEASADDLDVDAGKVFVRGVPSISVSFADVAAASHAAEMNQFLDTPGEGVEVDLRVENTYDGGAGGWSGGTHCAIVEVDAATGLVSFERYVVVEDCGEIINPAVVDGQICGGVAQGIGAVLLERSAYDDEGRYLSATFMDYLLPSTTDIPTIEVHHLESVLLDDDVNFRGVGEGGMIVTPACVVNAIEDALTPFGVEIREQHLPPARILELIGAIPTE
ncbi:MAG: xanthine dehydrogenase family protein molybdopterin-binding subunit, partial [Acidimicrobiia bacterium]